MCDVAHGYKVNIALGYQLSREIFPSPGSDGNCLSTLFACM